MTPRGFIRAYAIVWGLTLAAAAVVAVAPGAAPAARDALQLRLEPSHGDWGDALDYLTTNARVIAAIFLAAWTRSRCGRLARPLDVLVGLIIVGNTSLVGVAVGAYGLRLTPWLVHLPAEWFAVAVALRWFLAAATQPCRVELAFAIPCAAAALALAAALETFATPQS